MQPKGENMSTAIYHEVNTRIAELILRIVGIFEFTTPTGRRHYRRALGYAVSIITLFGGITIVSTYGHVGLAEGEHIQRLWVVVGFAIGSVGFFMFGRLMWLQDIWHRRHPNPHFETIGN